MFLLSIGACGDGAAPANGTPSQVRVSFERGELVPYEREALLVVCDDRSGSMSRNSELTLAHYKALAGTLQGEQGGTMAVRVVGDPNKLDFVRLDLVPHYRNLEMTKDDPLLSEKGLLRRKNERIKFLNDSIDVANQKSMTAFLDHIDKEVVNYRPHANDKTDVLGAMEHMEKLMNESTYQGRRITALVASDGVDDMNGPGWNLELKLPEGAQLALVNWAGNGTITGVEPLQFESVQGFVDYYTQQR
ncbi:MAG: hypothetical protein KDC03_03005 [Flavobacteriales bacterium]|nr:hypothetical protein [Flavobacteriales bacterium]